MYFEGKSNEILQIERITKSNCEVLKEIIPNAMTILWFESDGNILIIDSIKYNLNNNEIICLTEFHKIEISEILSAKMIRFNRAFYCIIEHDNEVGCKGILFFGATHLPSFKIPEEELKIFETVYNMFELELKTEDSLQLEMIQIMLKRFLILCTRVYKTQNHYHLLDSQQIQIIKEYNFLVEEHFRTKHSVSEFADMLNKSPKTLSNIFTKLSNKTPLQFIHERKMLEAKRLLTHTNKNISEIGFEIGFEDVQGFSRFFKKNELKSPTEYRELK